MHTHTHKGEHKHARGTVLPTALIKAYVISEVASGEVRGPGLIYLRGGIMNSLWHLIFPSLFIWLAGIRTAIHTAWASIDWHLTHSDALWTIYDLQPLTLRMLIVQESYSLPPCLPQAVKK